MVQESCDYVHTLQSCLVQLIVVYHNTKILHTICVCLDLRIKGD